MNQDSLHDRLTASRKKKEEEELNKWQLKEYNQFSAVIIYMSVSV
jgi:hypothetical protein